MVFFHGGRYEQGAAGVNLFDGAQIANYTNTIVVTVRSLFKKGGGLKRGATSTDYSEMLARLLWMAVAFASPSTLATSVVPNLDTSSPFTGQLSAGCAGLPYAARRIQGQLRLPRPAPVAGVGAR